MSKKARDRKKQDRIDMRWWKREWPSTRWFPTFEELNQQRQEYDDANKPDPHLGGTEPA